MPEVGSAAPRAVFLLSALLLYLLWRSLISCRPNVDFILELRA